MHSADCYRLLFGYDQQALDSKIHFRYCWKRGKHSNFALALGGDGLVLKQESCAAFEYRDFRIVIEMG